MANHAYSAYAGLLATFVLCVALPAAAQVIDLKDVKPECPKPYDTVPVAGKCTGDSAKLNDRTTRETCETTIGLTFDENTKKCSFGSDSPAPTCGAKLPDLVYKDGACFVDRSTPRSSLGNYEGDYFHIVAVKKASADIPFAQNTWIKVLSQRKLGDQDVELTVVAVKRAPIPFVHDKQIETEARTVRASDLAETGATRAGWTYGALALPFKYYSSSKRFTTNVSVGPYAGWRWGRPGSAVTIAATAAIGSVAGEVRDANDRVTGTPQLLAFSTGAGVMWDISKAPGTKPFKVGIFAGKDRVSSDDSVKFRNDNKWWVSLQIGYQFTDN